MANNTTVADCTALQVPGDVVLSNYNVTVGSSVSIGCRNFGHRVIGPHNITCLATGDWSDAGVECKWTWEFTMHEKLVLGTSIAAGAFLLLVTLIVIIAYCCCYRRRNDNTDHKNFGSVYEDRVTPSKKHDYDNYGPPMVEGGPGIYPDAYYAYQEYPDTKTYPSDMSDVSGLDRPWLGYIPRPKVADGRYYH